MDVASYEDGKNCKQRFYKTEDGADCDLAACRKSLQLCSLTCQ